MSQHGRIMQAGATGRRFGIGEAIEIRIVDCQLVEHVRSVVRRQQVDLATAQRRSEADGETVAIAAEIDHVTAARQLYGQCGDVGQEGFDGNRDVTSPGENRTGTQRRKQGKLGHRSKLPIFTDLCRPDGANDAEHVDQSLGRPRCVTPLPVAIFSAQHDADQGQIA